MPRPNEPSLLPLSQNVYVNINRIMSVASRLVESGHYASPQIKQIASQLEQEWKAFAAALDERSTLLDMSSVFHQKAEKVSACDPPATRRWPGPLPLRDPPSRRPDRSWRTPVWHLAQPRGRTPAPVALAVQPQAGDFTPLFLSFLTCEAEIEVSA